MEQIIIHMLSVATEMKQVATRILNEIYVNEIAFFFSFLIMAWFFVAILFVVILIVWTRLPRKSFARFIVITPTSLTTLGVLGTFTGILIGLLDFDESNIYNSLPDLLDGLKIAFTTSILGIAAAITFRLIYALSPNEKSFVGITAEDVHEVLTGIRDDNRKATELFVNQMTGLRESFEQFSEHMVENNQKAIIEALNQVIKDFNEKLTEQFGENFKRLDEAVHKLVTWQSNYKEQMEQMLENLTIATSSISASQKALESIQDHSERIPEAIKPLEDVLLGIRSQIQIMSAHLEALSALRDKAIEAFPTIEANLEKITSQFAEGIESVVTRSRETLDAQEETQVNLQERYQTLLDGTNEAREKFSKELSDSLAQMSEQSRQEFARHGTLIESAATEAQKSINESWAQSVKKMNDQFTEFDVQMQQELTRSLELMGQNLASISEKLTEDYKPIMEHLHNLIDSQRDR